MEAGTTSCYRRESRRVGSGGKVRAGATSYYRRKEKQVGSGGKVRDFTAEETKSCCTAVIDKEWERNFYGCGDEKKSGGRNRIFEQLSAEGFFVY